jgi:hypothetical protein
MSDVTSPAYAGGYGAASTRQVIETSRLALVPLRFALSFSRLALTALALSRVTGLADP